MTLVINMKTNKKQKLRHTQTSASAMSNSSEELKNLNLPFFKRRPREKFLCLQMRTPHYQHLLFLYEPLSVDHIFF